MAHQHQLLTPPSCPCSMTTNDMLARKPSDTSSSESTDPDEYGCGSFIINFFHLRSPVVDAVVLDDTTKKDTDADAEMMEADNMMVMAFQDAGTREEKDADNRKKPLLENRPTCYPYPSPSPEDVQGKKRLVTTPTLLQRRVDIFDINTNENQSIDLSMPKLSKSPPESLDQTHLISAANNIDYASPSLSLNSMMSMNHTQTYEGMMSHIPRIHLRMRNSGQTTVHRVTDNEQGRLPSIQQTRETIG